MPVPGVDDSSKNVEPLKPAPFGHDTAQRKVSIGHADAASDTAAHLLKQQKRSVRAPSLSKEHSIQPLHELTKTSRLSEAHLPVSNFQKLKRRVVDAFRHIFMSTEEIAKEEKAKKVLQIIKQFGEGMSAKACAALLKEYSPQVVGSVFEENLPFILRLIGFRPGLNVSDYSQAQTKLTDLLHHLLQGKKRR